MKSYNIRNGVRPSITTAELSTIGLVAGDKGAIFYNTDTDALIVWSGSEFKNVSNYDPNVADTLAMPEDVGGLLAGTTAGDLLGKDMNQLFDDLLFPTVLAYRGLSKSLSVTGVTNTGTREVGETYAFNLAASFNQGTIYDGNEVLNVNSLVGVVSSYDFNGPGTSNPTNQIGIDVSIAGNVVLGSNRWDIEAYHAEGTGFYYNNKGTQGTNLDSLRVAGSVSKNSSSKTGVYPIFYGMTADILSSGGLPIYTTLTKLVEAEGEKILELNGSAEYIYFAYPATYGDLVSIEDNNGFLLDIDPGSPQRDYDKFVANVESQGLGADYDIPYHIYKSLGKTSVAAGDFIFTF